MERETNGLADKPLAKTAHLFNRAMPVPLEPPQAPLALNTASIDTRDHGALRLRNAV